MYIISADGYKNANVIFLTIKKISEIWVNMKDVESGMGVKNISNLVLKEIYVIFETKKPTKKQVNEYKMTERKIYNKIDNLSEKKLNTKNNKKTYVRNDVRLLLLNNAWEKKQEV